MEAVPAENEFVHQPSHFPFLDPLNRNLVLQTCGELRLMLRRTSLGAVSFSLALASARAWSLAWDTAFSGS
jgi:hypothetical protein